MHITAHLDVDVIALETEDTVTTLVELTAPTPPSDVARVPATLVVVLDRSGSMEGPPLEGAKRALLELVTRLDPTDRFGLVTFDDEVEVVVPAAPLSDKEAVRRVIAEVETGGSTNLSGGYLRGVQEARRAATGGGATLILISDGDANAGIVDPQAMGAYAATARRDGLTTTTLGYGLGYDEVLLAALADGGAGEALFAQEPDTAAKMLAEQVEGLLSLSAQAATLRITMSDPVAGVTVLGDLPSTQLDDLSVVVELGDLYAGELRKLCLRFHVPAMPALGLATAAEIEIKYVELPALTNHTVTLPVSVNVVPGDQAAGRVPDVTVTSEVLFLEAQETKRRASEALRNGDASGAAHMLRKMSTTLLGAMESLPAPMAAEFDAQARELSGLAEESEYGDALRASKSSTSSWQRGTRKRGRP
jgi:Ca-activated chloride channel family protein